MYLHLKLYILVQFDDTDGTLLDRCSRYETLLDNLASSMNPGSDSSALHAEDSVSGSHACNVRYGAFAVLLLLDELDTSVSYAFSLAPDRIAVGVASAPVGCFLKICANLSCVRDGKGVILFYERDNITPFSFCGGDKMNKKSYRKCWQTSGRRCRSRGFLLVLSTGRRI